MKLLVPAMIGGGMMAVCGERLSAQAPADRPTKQEIATAYQFKSGEGGTAIPGTRWERRRIKEIRGRSLRRL